LCQPYDYKLLNFQLDENARFWKRLKFQHKKEANLIQQLFISRVFRRTEVQNYKQYIGGK